MKIRVYPLYNEEGIMRKNTYDYRLWVVIIIFLTLFLLAAFTPFKSREASGFLRVSDREVLDGAGDPLVLKGFNIALWLPSPELRV